jgi:hypothetical protein
MDLFHPSLSTPESSFRDNWPWAVSAERSYLINIFGYLQVILRISAVDTSLIIKNITFPTASQPSLSLEDNLGVSIFPCKNIQKALIFL